jgi:heme-degrading monooxygenase HmoA
MRAAVILRIVSGRVRHGRLETVTDAYTTRYRAVAMGTPGLNRFIVAVRPVGDEHELASMTLWSTVEAALAVYEGNLSAKRTLDDREHGEELTHVDYYEVDDGVIQHVGVEASYLRLTAGTVARGLDADIQQDLRRRLGDLPAQLAEGYVGRRVLKDVVEIAFVSTWSAAQDRASLEAPIWPEISSRYDTFRVDVFEVVLAGSPSQV